MKTHPTSPTVSFKISLRHLIQPARYQRQSRCLSESCSIIKPPTTPSAAQASYSHSNAKMEITIHIDLTTWQLYLALLILNILLSIVITTFAAHLFSTKLRDCCSMLPVFMFAINIPFSLVAFPSLAGPLLYYPALVISVAITLVGVLCFVGECMSGWKPADSRDNPWLGD